VQQRRRAQTERRFEYGDTHDEALLLPGVGDVHAYGWNWTTGMSIWREA
jgi:hypothetical protein